MLRDLSGMVKLWEVGRLVRFFIEILVCLAWIYLCLKSSDYVNFVSLFDSVRSMVIGW